MLYTDIPVPVTYNDEWCSTSKDRDEHSTESAENTDVPLLSASNCKWYLIIMSISMQVQG